MSSKRNGFSLIEVMVSLVILVIGLIGIFNLHIV
ncbi:prepilin-type N-terminal cleavage/methylation domain-containing protein, partial [Shewanella sp.]